MFLCKLGMTVALNKKKKSKKSISSLPVHITQSMDWVNGHNHLCQVELSHVLRDPILKFTEESQQVSTYIIIHHQVLSEKGLEGCEN